MNRRKIIDIVVSVVILFLVVGLTACLIIPAQNGRMMVIKSLGKSLCMIVLGILAAACGVLFFIKKAKYAEVLLIFGSLLFLAGTYGSYNAIRGLHAGPVSIEGGSYELDHSYDRSREYYIIVTSEIQRERVRIQINEDIYKYLASYTPNVSVTYYPYVNIAEKIEIIQ